MCSAALNHETVSQDGKVRIPVAADEADVLADIYRDDCNLAIWRRTLSPALQEYVEAFLQNNVKFQVSLSLSPQSALTGLRKTLGNSAETASLAGDIAELVDMYCYLFDTKLVGLRLTALQKPMCPRFHVDQVPCRLVTTFQGPATEWLPHDRVADRSKLGRGSEGKPDEFSGLIRHASDIHRAAPGEVLLLKGERWEGNEGAGLVHRSPGIADGGMRLLLTLDLI